ncbi:MAG: glycosyltransferase [Bacteroidetes bacterium]|nr:glycosyltransferase [Bacteroidota bacterium]
MSKLKIIWICHFSNSEVQSKLPLLKNIDMFAPWIPNMIKGFSDYQDIELHIISPHLYLRKQTSYFQNGVYYYFIPYGIPIIKRSWPRYFPFDVYTNYSGFRQKVKNIVSVIKPDLINLIGAENSYYSSSILDFKENYPILITIQGFISQMKNSLIMTKGQKKRVEIEEKILKEFKYFCGELDSSKYISLYNNNYKFFKHYGAINEDIAYSTPDQIIKYDCIYYGRIEKLKGAEDFIKVVHELKKTKKDIKACMIGHGDMIPYKTLANDLDCLQNIEFAGFIPTQKELFEKVKSAKVFLAPPLFERLSLTIREAMFLKVPIVAYATGGIPYINEYDENILLVDTGDYKRMAEKTIYLLNNEKVRNSISEKAYKYAQSEYTIKVDTELLIDSYKQIIFNEFHD